MASGSGKLKLESSTEDVVHMLGQIGRQFLMHWARGAGTIVIFHALGVQQIWSPWMIIAKKLHFWFMMTGLLLKQPHTSLFNYVQGLAASSEPLCNQTMRRRDPKDWH